jgi:PRTRC genetic system protein B
MTEPFDLGRDAGQYQSLMARLDLFSETIAYTRFEDGRPTTCHEVDPDDLATAFTGLALNTGLLPANCLFYGRLGGQERIGVFLEPAVRTLLLDDAASVKSISIPCPPLILVGHGVNYALYAVKQRPGADDRLYRAPFPNVYANGALCAGTATFPPCSAGTMRQAIHALFESRFNDHLLSEKSQRHPENVLDLWRELAEKRRRKYPLADLVATNALVSSLLRGDL